MAYELRVLGPDDQQAAWEMSRLAFGLQREPPARVLGERPGRTTWAAVDPSGRILAKATDRHQEQWFGGRRVPTAGIAGVVVLPELRGSGMGRAVLTRLLADARDRGAVISTLFRTTPAVYRRLGWEEVGRLTWTSLPTASLAQVQRPAGIVLRPADPNDVPAIRELYRAMAREGTGLMERSGPLFDESSVDVLADVDGVSVACGADGVLQGYAAWDRGAGYGASGRLTVHDLVGATPDAVTGLLSMLGSWRDVAPILHVRVPEPDPAALLGAFTGARQESTQPWMLRVVDAAAAVATRGWPEHVSGSIDLDLEDPECPWNAGAHRLTLADGTATLERTSESGTRTLESRKSDGSLASGTRTPESRASDRRRPAVRLGPRGLGALYAGLSPALLRRAGLLAGGDARMDAWLAAATAGPPPTLLDYF